MSSFQETKSSSRRSKRVKNLEKEVEFILSQEESDEDIDSVANKEDVVSKTPPKQNENRQAITPTASQTVLHELVQTPRRSCRKSIKPSQDYDDIVNRSLRLCTRSAKKDLFVDQKNIDEVDKNQENEIVQPKWTPAKVGRVSQKRKSRRNGKWTKKVNVEAVDVEEGGGDNKDKENFPTIDLTSDSMHQTRTNSENDIASVEKQEKLMKEQHAKLVQPLNESIEYKTEEIKELNDSSKNSVSEVFNADPVTEERIEVSEDSLQKTSVAKIEGKEYRSICLREEGIIDGINFESKLSEENIRIVFDNNISNEDIKTENKENLKQNNSFSKQDMENSFGSYLKSKEINFSELGLNPIKDEELEEQSFECKTQETISEVVEEMPSLIIYDDDCEEQEDNVDNNKLNETFETKDSAELDECAENPLKPSAEVMETLQMSDDEFEETPKKRPHIVLTDVQMQNHLLLSTPKGSAVKLSCTPKLWTTPNLPSTSKQSNQPYRFHTPYRNKKSFKFIKNNEKNVELTTEQTSNISMSSLTTLKPKEVVLRGIRKRSLSVCIDGSDVNRQKFLAGNLQKKKQNRVVSFCSPANQTTIIDDIDNLITKSIKKKNLNQTEEPLDKYVTTRRKRSLSFDETMMSTSSYISKLPRPLIHPSKRDADPTSSECKPLKRTKLPNFAAIHKKQFQKMENLVDHINRKQERSQNLINSATKLKPVSAKKNASTQKIENHASLETRAPKALKRIDLATAANKVIERTTPAKISNLPEPKIGLNKTINSSMIGPRQPQYQQNHKVLKPSQTTNTKKSPAVAKKLALQKPVFNLSTSLMIKPSTSTSSSSKANTTVMSSEDKMSSRLQRHMDLFRSRGVSARDVVTRKQVILRGVRSNRRFELQMQHRRNMDL